MNLKVVSYTLMLTGLGLFFAGIGVAFSQPSTPFTVSWWMIFGGWGVGMVGVGLHAYRVFTLLKEKLSSPRR
jgi:uncharacterized membrane protein